MSPMSRAATILRIELWHGLLLLILVLAFRRTKFIDPQALLLGGVFMGLNFFLLGFGILWVLAPLAGKGKVRAGVSLLILKMIIFLASLIILFLHYEIDGLSFALGFSTLIMAIFVEAVMHSLKLEQ
ncbi:MAG: hypothetical protein WD688_16985 [Candidatus Binatia bacterium]